MKYVVSRDCEGVFVQEVKDEELSNYLRKLREVANVSEHMVLSRDEFVMLNINSEDLYNKVRDPLDQEEMEEMIEVIGTEPKTYRFIFNQHVDIKAPSREAAQDFFEDLDLNNCDRVEYRDIVDVIEVE